MQQIIDFMLELEKLKAVTRKVRPLGQTRYENPAEHSWQIALLAASLARHAETEIDIHRVIGMLLVHDIGEIDTGDTMVFVEEGWEQRKAAVALHAPWQWNERLVARRLAVGGWLDASSLHGVWQ